MVETSHTKFHNNPSSKNRSRSIQTDGRTDMARPIRRLSLLKMELTVQHGGVVKTVTKLQRPQQTLLHGTSCKEPIQNTQTPSCMKSKQQRVFFTSHPTHVVTDSYITINTGTMLGHSTKSSYAADDALIQHTHRRKTYVIGVISLRRFISSVRLHPAGLNLQLHGPGNRWITYMKSPH